MFVGGVRWGRGGDEDGQGPDSVGPCNHGRLLKHDLICVFKYLSGRRLD